MTRDEGTLYWKNSFHWISWELWIIPGAHMLADSSFSSHCGCPCPLVPPNSELVLVDFGTFSSHGLFGVMTGVIRHTLVEHRSGFLLNVFEAPLLPRKAGCRVILSQESAQHLLPDPTLAYSHSSRSLWNTIQTYLDTLPSV